MTWPFQCIKTLRATSANPETLLVAATGSRLLISRPEDGAIIAEWTTQAEAELESEERPAKKQKTEASAPIQPNIVLLATHPQCEDFVAVTDDKCVHVLHLDGIIQVTSRRCMPKRPCSVEILPAEGLLLCADKFGDVYSLPLTPIPDEDEKYAQASIQDQSQPPKQFKSSASALTVHTRRNLMILESQKKQTYKPKKEGLPFEHKLLLGHVSMLTDLAYVKDPDTARGCIVTADRDEHIRVSRGPSQAYVIEGYCLGHTEFVSKLCPVHSSKLIASGGGDDWVGIWDWTMAELMHRVDIKQHLETSNLVDKSSNIAVAGIISVQSFALGNGIMLLAWCEKVNAILLITIQDAEVRVHVHSLDSTPLGATQFADRLVISVDDRKTTPTKLRVFNLTTDSALLPTLQEDTQATTALQNLSTKAQQCEDGSLDKFLYTTANLRKRGKGEGPQGGEDEE